jgi:hypothetical protein
MLLEPLKEGRRLIKDRMQGIALSQHRSNLSLKDSSRYSRYLKDAQSAYGWQPESAESARLAEQFRKDAVVTFWDPEIGKLAESVLAKLKEKEAAGEDIWDLESTLYTGGDGYVQFPEFEQMFKGMVGQVIRGILRCEFKLHHFRLRKSVRLRDNARGSELWHPDTGPGTCINMVIGLSELSKANGATQVLPWGPSQEIIRTGLPVLRKRLREAEAKGITDRGALREVKCQYYQERIDAEYADQVVQAIAPSGGVLMWNTNALHKGGYPEEGEERIIMLCHAYPSHKATDWERYRKEGCSKFAWPNQYGKGTQPFPTDPADDF